jgi:hypothetical protein
MRYVDVLIECVLALLDSFVGFLDIVSLKGGSAH